MFPRPIWRSREISDFHQISYLEFLRTGGIFSEQRFENSCRRHACGSNGPKVTGLREGSALNKRFLCSLTGPPRQTLSLLRNSAACAAEFSGRKQSVATLDAAWLPTAKTMKAREAIPRSCEPTVTVKRTKNERWNVYVRLPDGRQGRTTCNTEKDAKDRAQDFLAGVDVKLPGAATSTTTSTAAGSRKSGRRHADPITHAPKRVSTNYVAGPGRGHHVPVTRATLALQAMKKKIVLDFAEGLLSADIKEMDDVFIKALELVYSSTDATAFSHLSAAADIVIKRKHREDSVSFASKRTAQCHRAAMKYTLCEIAGSDDLKKVELLEAVIASLKQQTVTAQQEKNRAQARAEHFEKQAHSFIILSLRHSLAVLKQKNDGRYSHNDRVVQQAILSAASCKLPPHTFAAAARLLDTDERGLGISTNRWDQFEAGERDTVFAVTEKAPHAFEYSEFVQQQWLELTRESERMADELRNPKDRSDPHLYRIHFQEDRTEDLLDMVFANGVNKFGAHNFHLSMKTFMKFKPFQVRKPDAETCVCVYHLKWCKVTGNSEKH